MTALERHLVQLSDISLLARVQRPVVTTWKARHAGRAHPFPAPVRVLEGQDLFDVDDVVSWLEATGCGNNPDARQDAVAFTLTAAEVVDDDSVFAGLTALICLRGSTGPLPVAADDLLDAAEAFDSDDQLLFSEVEAVEALLEPLARYAELLVLDAFDPTQPFDELVRRRSSRNRRPQVHPTLRQLVARAAMALADEAGFSEPTLVVRTVDDVDLVIEAATQTERRGTLSVALTLGSDAWDSADARLVRRWLHVHGIPQSQIVTDPDGAYALPDGAVLVLRLPTASTDREPDLNEVSNLCLNLSPMNRAVVVGPSGSLTDPLLERRGRGRPSGEGAQLSPAGQSRQDALRTDAVRAVIRLPHGLLPEQSRSRAALWCLGPSRSTPPSTLCADLSRTLSDRADDDLLTDLVAAMQGPASEVARQLSTAEFRPTSTLIMSTHDLVAPIVHEVHLGSAPVLDTLERVLSRNADPVPGIGRTKLGVPAQAGPLQRMSLDQAVRDHHINLIAGVRIESSALHPHAEVPVVRHPMDLARRHGVPGLSEITLATTYAHVERTRPGDIVVTTAGGPSAAVDHDGGAVVAFPARVLRCHRPREVTREKRKELEKLGQHPPDLAAQTFTPEAVAADINAQPATATRWKAWPLTVLPADQIEATERMLFELAERRTLLEAARADVDVAIRTLTQAVGAQICTVSPPGLTRSAERKAL